MAHEKSLELTELGVGTFDGPSVFVASEFYDVLVAPVFAILAVRNDEVDAAFREPSAHRVRVVGAVGDHAFGLLPRPAFGRGTLTSASVASARVTSAGEALPSRTPSGRPPPLTSTIHFVPLPHLLLPTAGPPFSPERSCRPGTSLPISAALRCRAHPAVLATHSPTHPALPTAQPRLAGRRRRTLIGQEPPRRVSLQHPQDALQTGPVRRSWTALLVLATP